MSLEEQLKLLPDRPGVYLMKDEAEKILYIGKAVSLKNRVRSYFQSSRNLTTKVLAMVSQVRDVEVITTDSGVEALILESNLIKKHKPKYNIRLKDDKHYPYLKVTLNEKWPRLLIARQVKKDGARYFGPYTTSGAVRETMRLARRIFPLRTCNRVEAHSRPCLNLHIGRCLGPCKPDYAGESDYEGAVRDLCLFLEGREEELVKKLRAKMEEAAENLRFERAAEIRDQIRAIEMITEKQKIISSGLEDQDVIAYARSGDETCVQVFFVRSGKLIGREHFRLTGTEGLEGAEILDAFLKQFYSEAAFVPREILVPDDLEDAEVIREWLSRRRGGKVLLTRPRRGAKKELLDMVFGNAKLVLDEQKAGRQREFEATEGALSDLQERLRLPGLPERIECYDISHTQGSATVASMVVFEGGKPVKGEYRRFRIRTVEGPDDFASMAEVIERRFRRGLQEREARVEGRPRDLESFARFPDLVIIDGGKGQLSSARGVMRRLGLEHIPTFGLAKENEWLFGEGNPDPIILPRESPALFLLQRVRDEAHRFAVTYHRNLRGKEGVKSALDEIPGVGPARKKALLRKFGSVVGLRRATAEELTEVDGISAKLAETIKEYLGGSS